MTSKQAKKGDAKIIWKKNGM